MRLLRVRRTARPPSVAVTLAAVLLTVIICLLITADHALATPDAKVYTCRIWWQRNEGTPAFARLGPRRLLTSLEDWGPAVGLDAADFDGTGRPGLLVAAKLPSQGRPYRAAVWYYPKRPVPFR